jgi:hypothetical protein
LSRLVVSIVVFCDLSFLLCFCQFLRLCYFQTSYLPRLPVGGPCHKSLVFSRSRLCWKPHLHCPTHTLYGMDCGKSCAYGHHSHPPPPSTSLLVAPLSLSPI